VSCLKVCQQVYITQHSHTHPNNRQMQLILKESLNKLCSCQCIINHIIILTLKFLLNRPPHNPV
jgi:hypothetical protein